MAATRRRVLALTILVALVIVGVLAGLIPSVPGLIEAWTSTTTPRCSRSAAADLARDEIFSQPPGVSAKVLDPPAGGCRDADGSSVFLAEAEYELTRPGEQVVSEYVAAAVSGGWHVVNREPLSSTGNAEADQGSLSATRHRNGHTQVLSVLIAAVAPGENHPSSYWVTINADDDPEFDDC